MRTANAFGQGEHEEERACPAGSWCTMPSHVIYQPRGVAGVAGRGRRVVRKTFRTLCSRGPGRVSYLLQDVANSGGCQVVEVPHHQRETRGLRGAPTPCEVTEHADMRTHP